MNDTDARRAYVARIMRRVQRAYSERALLLRADGLHVYPCEELATGRCVCQGEYTMSLNLLQRLYRDVISEGYGL